MNSGERGLEVLREWVVREDMKSMRDVEADMDMDKPFFKEWRERIKTAHRRIGAIAVALSFALQGCVFWVGDDDYHHHRGYEEHRHGWYQEHSSMQQPSQMKQGTGSGMEAVPFAGN